MTSDKYFHVKGIKSDIIPSPSDRVIRCNSFLEVTVENEKMDAQSINVAIHKDKLAIIDKPTSDKYSTVKQLIMLTKIQSEDLQLNCR